MIRSRPFLVDDMEALVLACAAEPIRLRVADGGFYKKDRLRIEKALAPLPEEILSFSKYNPETRLGEARAHARELGLLEADPDLSGGRVLVPTAGGRAWMGLDEVSRHRMILECFRPLHGDAGWNDEGAFDRVFPASVDALIVRLSMLPVWAYGMHFGHRVERELEEAAIEAFRWLDGDEPTHFEDFLDHVRAQDNPLLDPEVQRRMFFLQDADLEGRWLATVTQLMVRYLVPLGALAVGWRRGGERSLQLTPAGRYLFGLTHHLEDPLEAGGEGVRVQADFEVVFMAPSPAAERAIGRFSERVGRGVGTLFRITPESVRAAAAAGLTADGTIDTLRRTCPDGLPENVEREIRGWMDGVRRLEAREIVAIDCGDRETAARVAAIGGRGFRLAGEALVVVTEGRIRPALSRKLAAAGIFVDARGGES
jgi:hypothetical protein